MTGLSIPVHVGLVWVVLEWCACEAEQIFRFCDLGSGENGQPRGRYVTAVFLGVLATLSKIRIL
jgi:hypothetical protein